MGRSGLEVEAGGGEMVASEGRTGKELLETGVGPGDGELAASRASSFSQGFDVRDDEASGRG